MIIKKVGNLVIEIPESMIVDGEELSFTPSDLIPVFSEGSDPDDNTPIGFNLVHEVPGNGTVNNGIYVDYYGDTNVLSGPLDERDNYEHPDDSPIDTHFTPPSSFTDQISVYIEYDDDDDD
ncbi:hypothetical protein [Providencia stuartii]|uniref:hypothetical protein n=2 Tax=Providencia TaxID=586 RepID=UPI0034E48CAC